MLYIARLANPLQEIAITQPILLSGLVIAAHGRQYRVQLSDGRTVLAFPRGKKSAVACGDQVEILENLEKGASPVIEKILPRKSLLYRSDLMREKLIAANVTQIVIVAATEPSFSDELLTRCLVIAEQQQLKSLIVLNKCDLPAQLNTARERLQDFRTLGYTVIELSALADISSLRQHLQGEASILIGQSGMGKSTLINALIPEAHAATREISTALDSGKHTTTHATLYRLGEQSFIIDSPGLQEFGLRHVPRDELESTFPELLPLLGHCRFRNCRHDQEPECALRLAAEENRISRRRFDVYCALRDEIEAVLGWKR